MESETVLQIRRSFSASPTKVYKAWTEKDQFSSWFAPTEEYKTVIHDLDVRVGGKYRVEMQAPNGNLHIVRGIYSEVIPARKLVFSWSWETKQDWGETEVTLEFQETARGTDLVLTHKRFPSREARDEHNQGWAGCLDRLGKLVDRRL
jgi:uncharacterized protein YndB with AHSA1/START domain